MSSASKTTENPSILRHGGVDDALTKALSDRADASEISGVSQQMWRGTPQNVSQLERASKPLRQTDNPLLRSFDGPLGTPRFDQLREDHFLPAYMQGIAEARAEINAIINNPGTPEFLRIPSKLWIEVAGRFFVLSKFLGSSRAQIKLQAY